MPVGGQAANPWDDSPAAFQLQVTSRWWRCSACWAAACRLLLQSARLQGTSTPYDVPVALSLLKLPSGALSALVGLLFIRGEFIPGLSQLDSQPQILAYAFLFGIAQQLVTGMVDRQAQDIMAKVPSKEPVSAQPEPPPALGPTQKLGWARRWRSAMWR